MWALSHLGPLPATSVTSPALSLSPPASAPLRSRWKFDYCQLCSVLSQTQIPGSHWEGDLPPFRGGPLQILTLALPSPFADPCAATKSKTSEDIAQSSKYSPAYSPDPYYHSESEYWSFQGSPKGNKSPWGWDKGRHIPASKFSGSKRCLELGLDTKVGLG